ncbi:MAG: hypothetical protein ACOX1S_03840 [Anaerostipes sp.]|jgi:hypothetical protein
MKDFIAKNNPTPQRMRGRGDEVSKTHFLNILVVLLRHTFEHQKYIGLELCIINTAGLIMIISGLKYILEVPYPKVLAALFAADLMGGGLGVVIYILVQRQFISEFTSEMKQVSFQGMVIATVLMLIMIWVTCQFIYPKLGWNADMKLPVPMLFVFIYIFDCIAGVYTYVRFSWQNTILVAVLFLVLGLVILYGVNEVTRRKAECEIIREYHALKIEKESMRSYGNTILMQNQRREELQRKIENQLEYMERYMKNNPKHHEIEAYVEELKKLYQNSEE